MARILLGVSGSVAAYKALEFARLAVQARHQLRVIQTPTALKFVGSASFAAISGAPVLVSEFERDPLRGAFPGQDQPDHDPASHLELARNADLLVIAPASANTIAKLAAGLADNLLTSTALAAPCPVIVAPAMNNHMWGNAATQANVQTLRARGVSVIEPGTGELATHNEWGAGRLAEPADLLATVEAVVPAGPRPWDGLDVLVTAGGTREPIDAVRYVGNRSSGKMGIALAAEAAALGASVTLIAANVSTPGPASIRRIDVGTAAQLAQACEVRFATADVLIMAAAVADFRPDQPTDAKLKKAGRSELVLRLTPTADILAQLASRRREGQTVVGFAAETGPSGLAHARAKLADKGLDAIVFNDVGRAEIGFDSDDNEVTVITAAGERTVSLAGKPEIARAVLETVAELRAPVESQPR